MVKPKINVLASAIAHMPLLSVWRDSGVTQKHGFEMTLNLVNTPLEGQPALRMEDRIPKLMEGTYDFLSGVHIEAYIARAHGDKRIVYLAQPQNELDDRLVATKDVRTPKDLEGKRIVLTSGVHCVFGNLKTSLRHSGVDPERIEFVFTRTTGGTCGQEAIQRVAGGEAAAASVDWPFDRQGEKQGLHLINLPSLPIVHNVTLCGNEPWIQENEETTYAVIRSLVDAIHFFKTEKDGTCEILDRNLTRLAGLQGEDEVEHLQETWAASLHPKPYPHPLAVWNVWQMEIAPNPKINFIAPFEMWNTSYLRAIDSSGYIEELYGGPEKAKNPDVYEAINDRPAEHTVPVR